MNDQAKERIKAIEDKYGHISSDTEKKHKKLNDGKWKVYQVKLCRDKPKSETGLPNCIHKVGITQYVDAESRLRYVGDDEPHPIVDTFSNIKVMRSIIVGSKEEAEIVEKTLMKYVKQTSGDEHFHNWYEPFHISGITEMRVWDYDEVQLVRKVMDFYEKNQAFPD